MNSDINELIKMISAFYQITIDESLENELSFIIDRLFTSAKIRDSNTYRTFLGAAKVLSTGEALTTLSSVTHPTIDLSEVITAFSDGACSGNPGVGGWGAVVVSQGTEYQLSGREQITTNNRMELTGSIEALSFIKKNGLTGKITITTDSQYVKNGITSWMTGWKKNGWLTTTKEPVKNKDLWLILDELNIKLKPGWLWVKGHKGHYYNELCDTLAVKERDLFKK